MTCHSKDPLAADGFDDACGVEGGLNDDDVWIACICEHFWCDHCPVHGFLGHTAPACGDCDILRPTFKGAFGGDHKAQELGGTAGKFTGGI